MGHYAVILVIAAFIFGAVLLFNAQLSAEDANQELSAYQVDRFARGITLVGLKEAERNLNNATDTWVLWTTDEPAAQALFGVPTTSHDGGTYSVAIDSFAFGVLPTDPDIVWLTASGTYDGWDAASGMIGTTDYTVKATYETGLTNLGVPPGLREAIQTEEDLTIQGNGCVSGGVHANGDLDTNGGAFDVLGQGTYTGSDATDPDGFTGGVVYSDSVSIPITPIPPPLGTITYTISADTTLDASNAPPIPTELPDGWFGVTGHGGEGDAYILYVDGNLIIDDDVYLVGYSGIYVNGTVTILGNTTISPVPASVALPVVTAAMDCETRMAVIGAWSDLNLPNGSQLGIFAQGDIIVGGNTSIVATLVTNAAFTYSGGGASQRLIIGGITAQNDLTLSGNTMIYYTEASEEIIPGGNQLVPNGIRLIGYREWAERP